MPEKKERNKTFFFMTTFCLYFPGRSSCRARRNRICPRHLLLRLDQRLPTLQPRWSISTPTPYKPTTSTPEDRPAPAHVTTPLVNSALCEGWECQSPAPFVPSDREAIVSRDGGTAFPNQQITIAIGHFIEFLSWKPLNLFGGGNECLIPHRLP